MSIVFSLESLSDHGYNLSPRRREGTNRIRVLVGHPRVAMGTLSLCFFFSPFLTRGLHTCYHACAMDGGYARSRIASVSPAGRAFPSSRRKKKKKFRFLPHGVRLPATSEPTKRQVGHHQRFPTSRKRKKKKQPQLSLGPIRKKKPLGQLAGARVAVSVRSISRSSLSFSITCSRSPGTVYNPLPAGGNWFLSLPSSSSLLLLSVLSQSWCSERNRAFSVLHHTRASTYPDPHDLI